MFKPYGVKFWDYHRQRPFETTTDKQVQWESSLQSFNCEELFSFRICQWMKDKGHEIWPQVFGPHLMTCKSVFLMSVLEKNEERWLKRGLKQSLCKTWEWAEIVPSLPASGSLIRGCSWKTWGSGIRDKRSHMIMENKHFGCWLPIT